MPLFLDPLLFLGNGVSSAATSLASRCVAAYIVYVGALLARETVDPSRLEALRLPSDSNMARASPLCAIDWGSDDEVWLHPNPPPAMPPPIPPPDPPARARGQSRPGMARSTTSPVFCMLQGSCDPCDYSTHLLLNVYTPAAGGRTWRRTERVSVCDGVGWRGHKRQASFVSYKCLQLVLTGWSTGDRSVQIAL